MNQIQAKFDRAFKHKGGIYINPNEEITVNKMLSVARRTVAILSQNAGDPDIYVDLINNPTLNAAATKYEGQYFIGLNAGALMLIVDIFNRMLCSKNIFTDVGDISLETGCEKRYPNEFLDFIPHDYQIPQNKERSELAQVLIATMLDFLVFHECCHIFYGHVDYFQSALGVTEINEYVSAVGGSLNIDPAISQTLEFDADCGAVGISLSGLNWFLNDKTVNDPSVHRFYEDWPTMIRCFAFSVGTFFRLFAHGNSFDNLRSTIHPAPSLRASYVMGTVATVFQTKYDTTFLDKYFVDVVRLAIDEVEIAFSEISEAGYDNSGLHFAWSDIAQAHQNFLMRNWNDVRPLLEPFATAKLAPAYVPGE